MRPRQACLGIHDQDVLVRKESAKDASMRPRQACLGIHAETGVKNKEH